MTTHTAHQSEHAGHHSHRPTYYKVFAALMVLLVLTVGAAMVPLSGQGNIAVALGIAIVKAALIVMFFMHFRDSDQITWIVGLATVAWFMILILLTLNDYNSRDLITSMPGK